MADAGSSQGGSSYDPQSSIGSHDRGSEGAASSAAGLSQAGAEYGDQLSRRGSLADQLFHYLGATEKLGIEKSWKLQGLILLYQVVFLGIYAMHPNLWGDSISWTDNPIGRWALRIQGTGWATVSRDERVLTGLALCAIVVTLLHAALAFHVGYSVRRGKVPRKAELVIVRVIEFFYYKVFGLTALAVLVAPLSCNWSGQLAGKTSSNIFLNSSQCTGTLTLIGLGGLAVALLVHAPMYVLLAIKDCELNPVTPVPFAGGSMPAVARIAVLKVVSLLVVHLLTGAVPVLSAIIAVLLWSWIVYVTVVRLPFLGHAHARARAFCAGAIACAFLASAVQVGGINAAPLLAAVAPVGGLLAQAGARARMCNAVAVVGKFKEIRKNVVQTDERLHKFIDHEDPELIIRSLRKTDAQRTIDPEDVDGCFSAVNHSVSHFPDRVEVVLAMAIIQAFCLDDVHAAHSSAQKARGMPVSLSTRIELLTLEKELRKRQNSTAGDSMDWSTYVELQHRLRVLLLNNKKAIEVSRDVWKTLLKSEIGVDDVAVALKRMDKHELAANNLYKAMIGRHGTYPKLLQMNGRFLEDVQDNAGLAMQYFQEAERLDEAIVARNNAATSDAEGVAGVSGDVPSMTNIDEARDCVVVIDTEGVINFANSNVSQLFGYKRGELVGRNVSTLMPQPFSQQHDRFLKNYAITGQPHIINRVMPLVALHQNGTLFSITACITKISQNGRDGFMGVLRPREADDGKAVLYMTSLMQIAYITKVFTMLSGWGIQQLQGQRVGILFPDEAGLRSTIVEATHECGEEAPLVFNTQLQSKFGERFEARAMVTWVGSPNARLFIMRIERTDEEPPLVVVNGRTQVVSHNLAFKRLCGQNEKSLVGSLISKSFAYPCSAIYGSRLEKAGDDPAARSATIEQKIVRIPARNAQGFVYAQITMLTKGVDDEGEPEFTFRFVLLDKGSSPAQGAENHAAVTLMVDGQGVVTGATQHCQCTTPAFGFTSEGLAGQPLNKVVLMRGPMEPFLAAWLEATRAPPFQSESQLVSVRHENGSMRFGVAYFNADYELVGEGRDARPVGEPSLSVTLYCLDFLPVVLDMHDDTTIRQVYGSVYLLTGQLGDSLAGQPAAAVVPQLFRQVGNSANGLLVLPGQRRAGSNQHRHVVGAEHFSETLAGTLGVKVTCQAARIQGTKDTVMMLLEPTGPSPGPVQMPVARAFIQGYDDVHQRAGLRQRDGVQEEGGNCDDAAKCGNRTVCDEEPKHAGGLTAAPVLPDGECMEAVLKESGMEHGAATADGDGVPSAEVATQPAEHAQHVDSAAYETRDNQAAGGGSDGRVPSKAPSGGGASLGRGSKGSKGRASSVRADGAADREGATGLLRSLDRQQTGSVQGVAMPGPPRPSQKTQGGQSAVSCNGSDGEETGARQGFAFQRMRDWVDHDGAIERKGLPAVEEGLEPKALTGAAITRLQESLMSVARADHSGSFQGAAHESGQRTMHVREATASVPRDRGAIRANSLLLHQAKAAATAKGLTDAAQVPKAAQTPKLAHTPHAAPDGDASPASSAPLGLATAPGKLGSSDEKTNSDAEDHVESQSHSGDGDGALGGDGGADGEAVGATGTGQEGSDGQGLLLARKKSEGLSDGKGGSEDLDRKSSVSASVMSEGAGEGAVTHEAEDDMQGLELLEHETAQARGRKFKRVYGMLSSQVMTRPVTIARLTMLVVSMVIIVVQCIGFSQILLRIVKHNKLSAYVVQSGTAIKYAVDMKRYARLLQGLSMGFPIPGSSFENNQRLFTLSTNQFLKSHNALYHTASMFQDKTYKPQFQELWLRMDLEVTVLTASSYAIGGVDAQKTTNLWECGNTYASYGLELAKMTEADISQGDIAPLASFQYLSRNGLDIVANRYEQLLAVLIAATKYNLLQIGVVSLIFLALNLGVVVPIGLVLIHRGISASLRVRASTMAILIAVPRRLVLAMSRRPVNLKLLEDLADEEQEEDSTEKNTQAQTQEAGISSKAMRLLLSQRIDYERVKVVRDQVMSRQSKQRTQQVLELYIVGPFLLWAAVTGALYGVTWTLQSNTSVRLEPSRVAYVMAGYTAKTLASATDLVVDTSNALAGSPWARQTAATRASLAANQVVVQSAVDALIWGNSTFLGQYHVPGGTVVFNSVLRNIYFTHQCFSTVACLPDSDPLWPSVGRGYYALMSRFDDMTSALPDERDVDLVVTNVRYQFLQAQGDDTVRVAQEKVQVNVNTVASTINTIIAIHVILFLGTVVSGVCFTILLLRPLRRMLATEVLRLSHLMAELPKELAIEEAVVALVEEMSTNGNEENIMEMADGAEAIHKDITGAKDASAKAALEPGMEKGEHAWKE